MTKTYQTLRSKDNEAKATNLLAYSFLQYELTSEFSVRIVILNTLGQRDQ